MLTLLCKYGLIYSVETEAYISLGSNLGDRELNLLQAVAELGKLPDSKVTALSRFYVTPPVDMPEGSPDFYNAVARLQTSLPPEELLLKLQQIEQGKFGRIPSAEPVSRKLDLDLLLHGDTVMDTPELTLPHPRMTLRCFVLQPLAELEPDLIIPGQNKTVQKLLAKVATDQQVRVLE